MAVVGLAAELPNSPEGGVTEDKIEITRRYLVLTNSYSDGPAIVLDAIGIPALNQYYATANETITDCRVRSRSAKRVEDNSLYWEVEIKYSTPENGAEETENEKIDPLLELPEISTTFETHEEPVVGAVDITNGSSTNGYLIDAIRNSAGQYYDPPPNREVSNLVLTITRNEPISTVHPALAVTYQDCVNDDTFWGQPEGSCKCTSIEVRKEQKKLPNDFTYTQYLKVTYVFEFRDTWDIFVLDKGTIALETSTGGVCSSSTATCNPVGFLTDDGHPYEGLLNGSGGKLADGDAPVFLGPFEIYKRRNFDLLNLPQSFSGAKSMGPT